MAAKRGAVTKRREAKNLKVVVKVDEVSAMI